LAILDQIKHELQEADRDSANYERLRAAAMSEAYAATVKALSNAISARDAYMGRHAERVAAYGLCIAQAEDELLAADPQIEFGFLLHDIGKLAVPDQILNKRGPLTAREWRLIRRHPEIGYEILGDIDFLDRARCVVLHHHERWDGRGYPQKLHGGDIPIEARVFAVADALDAMTSDRPYSAGVSFAEARVEIEAGAGSQFDPHVVEAMQGIPDAQFDSIREANRD
jgi:HD-GYP domain-containing protein (c-di-GMP phosphodiesterase class II)